MKPAEFAQLQVFVVVAERCNFRESAAALGMAPSSISQMVRALEKRLDVQLFNRTTRSVRLTSAGRLLLTRAKPLLGDLERVLDDAEDLGNGTHGHLRLVASRAASRLVLPEIMAGFHRSYPHIELDLAVDDAITNIVESGFDAGVRVGYLLEKDMVALPLGGEHPSHVVASPEHLRSGALVSLLPDATLPLPAFHLYYLRSRHQPQAMRKLVDFIRERLV